jgi:hypothetical protein
MVDLGTSRQMRYGRSMAAGRSALLALASIAGCGDSLHPPSGDVTDQLALFFRMEETGDVPRVDQINGTALFPWQRLGTGSYHQDGIGTTVVAGVVGNGQHIAGASGYHFASRATPAMDHAGNGFTWVGWASVDAPAAVDPYLDNQTLVAKWTGIPDTEVPPDLREYRLWFEPALGSWRFEVSSDGLEGPGHSVIVTHPNVIEHDRMYFLEAWHDADAQTVNLRVSDQVTRGAVESASWDLGVYANEADLDVGAQNACSDDHLQGTIDALGYWTRALSDTESAALWNAGSGSEL